MHISANVEFIDATMTPTSPNIANWIKLKMTDGPKRKNQIVRSKQRTTN